MWERFFCLTILARRAAWLPLDGNDADVLVCSVYKWLCAPIGGAFLIMRPELAEQFSPVVPGWIAGKDVMAAPYGTEFDWATGPPKFDMVPNLISMIGAKASIDLISEIGVEKIHAHDVALANRFRAAMQLPPSNSAIAVIPSSGALERLREAGMSATEWRGNLRGWRFIFTIRKRTLIPRGGGSAWIDGFSGIMLCVMLPVFTDRRYGVTMPPFAVETLADLKNLIGHEFGPTEWMNVPQQQIQQFADATKDWQWIHLDAERAQKESPYHSTIAHGFLTLSLLPLLSHEAFKIRNGLLRSVN